MAALGAIANSGLLTKRAQDLFQREILRGLVCGDKHMVRGGRDDTEGNSAPSLRMDARGTFTFTWVVEAVARDLYVDVKQAANLSPRPRVTIKANADIGIAAAVTSSAASSTGWVTIGPLSVVPTAAGVLIVVLENLYDSQFAATPCYWDNITESEP